MNSMEADRAGTKWEREWITRDEITLWAIARPLALVWNGKPLEAYERRKDVIWSIILTDYLDCCIETRLRGPRTEAGRQAESLLQWYSLEKFWAWIRVIARDAVRHSWSPEFIFRERWQNWLMDSLKLKTGSSHLKFSLDFRRVKVNLLVAGK